MLDIATNKKGYHNFEILEKIEAGLVLTGPEIKAVRARQVNLAGSYARLLYSKTTKNPELWWVGGSLHVTEGDATRSRKLLVHKTELQRFIGKLQEKRLTLIPTRLYLKHGRAKLELGLGRGKQLHDKRESMKQRDTQREVEQAQKSARI